MVKILCCPAPVTTCDPYPLFLPEFSSRHVFFTGKGGVGKTSLSCATAVALADRGKRVLLVSTDPASNLDEVLQTDLTSAPGPVANVPGLHALNLDPLAAAAAYRERALAPVRGLLPPAVIARMEEELSGACTVEIAAFDAFTVWMNDKDGKWDHIVFDTAPTGHTLRLMGLSRAWDQFLSTNTTGQTCLGPLSGLEKQRSHYEETARALADAHCTTMVLVARPEASSMAEAERTSRELAGLGVQNQQLVLNTFWDRPDYGDAAARAIVERQKQALHGAADFMRSLPVSQVPMRSAPVLGICGLRAMLKEGGTLESGADMELEESPPVFEEMDGLIRDLVASGGGVILVMGKGGVGKTTIASGLALTLAQLGHRVHLTTTDPANHLMGSLATAHPLLSIGSIHPGQVTEAYRREVMETAGVGLDEAGQALLEEDLRSPCTEEIAVFRAFAREVAKGTGGFVVLDTAPTGHTLLLLDASLAFHREAERQTRDHRVAEVEELLPRLRDPAFTRVLLVTLPEPTPVHEAAALQEDLRRAGIEPRAWLVNQSLRDLVTDHPVLRGRRARENSYLREVTGGLARRAHLLPWCPVPPATPEACLALFQNPTFSR